MPRLPMDYSKTIIYKIVSNDLNITECYVGHTTNFINRKRCHKSSCNNEASKGYNYNVYQFIRDNGGWCNWSMIEIEKFPCADMNEATARERYYIETLHATLNCKVPTRTKQEYNEIHKEEIRENHKIYRENHKEEYSKMNKEWREKNDEYIKEKVECECGCIVARDTMRKHIKTDKHKLSLTT